MPTLKDLEEIINPADPSLTGLIPVGTTAASGIINSNAVGNATDKLTMGTQEGINTVTGAGGNVQNILEPYATAGKGALTQLSAGLEPGGGLTDSFSFDPETMLNDPGYQFRLTEGRKGIDAAAAARGLYDSGGTLKQLNRYNTDLANQYYNQDYSRAENTFNTNKAQRLKALQELTGTGLEASQGQVQGQEWTATQISDLLGQKADALAAGDVAGANAITQTLNGVSQAVTSSKALKKLYDIFKPGGGLPQVGPGGTAPFVDAAGHEISHGINGAVQAGIGNLGTLAGAGTIAEGIGTPSLIGQVGTTAAETAPGAGTAGAFGSIGNAIQSAASGAVNGMQAVGSFMLSNPITIVAGVAILAVTAILKSQAHWEANTLVKDVQQPFGENLGKIVNNFDQALASGQLDRQSAQELRDSTAAMINDFNNKVYEFSQGGDDKKEAALNAMRTMAENFGARADYPNLPSYDLILGKMDQEIAQLPEGQPAPAPQQSAIQPQQEIPPSLFSQGYGDNPYEMGGLG